MLKDLDISIYFYMLKYLKSFFIIDDIKDSIFNRKWKRTLVFDYKQCLLIGYEVQLIQFKGEKLETPRAVENYYLILNYNPKRWGLSQSHIYYDGPNCSYKFLFLEYSKSGGSDCKKCRNS